MTLLSVAIALVAVLCLVDLVLTLGVVRRLRDHSQRLALLQDSPTDELAIRSPGGAVDPFTATSMTGEAVSFDDLTEPTLVGFFAPDCPSCVEKLPSFISYAKAFPGGKRRTLAVVAGEAGGVKYRRTLAEVATVVVERELGPVQKAFGTSGFPAFAVVVDGVIVQSAHDVTNLPEHQPA
ncbi:MAG: TlpA family protein disulfide reductase [Pseudonocardiaceae bacterium]